MKKIYRKMMVLMNRKQKLKMVQILFMMVIGAVLETVSIGLVVPAIQMIMDPSCVEGDSALAQIYRWTGFQKPGYFTTLILVLIILGFVLKNVFLYFQNVVQLRFVYTNQFETSQRMMINFMKRPYEYYLNADTSVIQRMITSDVNNMYGLILALLQLMSDYFRPAGGYADRDGSADDPDGSGASDRDAACDQAVFKADHASGGHREPGLLQRSVQMD